jgi:hypothetical protein
MQMLCRKMKYIILFIILISTTAPALACEGTNNEWVQILNSRKYTVNGPFNIEEMESNNLIRINKKWLPFGNQNNEWVKMKNIYKDGDRFYSVILEDSKKSIVAQHVLVRNGCIIESIVVAVS